MSDFYNEPPDDWLLTDSCCTCFQGHAPCSFCVDTFECDSCIERAFSDEIDEETEYGFICQFCHEIYEHDKVKFTLGRAAEEMFLFLFLLAYAATLNDLLIHFMK